MSAKDIVHILWEANGGNTIRSIKNAGSKENVGKMKQAIEIASFMIPASSAASAALHGVNVASRGAAKVSKVAKKMNAASAARAAAAGKSAKAASKRGSARTWAENERTFSRTAQASKEYADKVDSLVWRKPELARLRAAIIAGNAYMILDESGRPIRIMF